MEGEQKNNAIWYAVGAVIIIIAAYLLFFRGAEEVAPGYKRRDKVMKPAKVKVFKKSNS